MKSTVHPPIIFVEDKFIVLLDSFMHAKMTCLSIVE